MTAYQRIRHKPYGHPVFEFGEAVHYKIPKPHIGPGLFKYDSSWDMGIYLGTRTRSGEYIVSDAKGIHKVRTIKRFPPDQRWNTNMINAIRGVPWDFQWDSPSEPPGDANLIPIAADSGEKLPDPLAEGGSDAADHEDVRDFKIFRTDLEDPRFGYTPDCPGCLAARAKARQRPHSMTCRQRLRKLFSEQPDKQNRVNKANDRISNKNRHDEDDQDLFSERNIEIAFKAKEAHDAKMAVDEASKEAAPADSSVIPIVEADADLFMDGPVEDADMPVGMLAQLAIEYIKYGHHVSEIYSPLRVNRAATKIGLKPGFSLDLTETDPYDGMPWDFSKEEKRARARKRVVSEKPFLLVGSPPCTAFSTLFQSNVTRMHPDKVRQIVEDGMMHLRFCIELYRIQLDAGRFFLHEHPWSASSWRTAEMQELLQDPRVTKVRGNMCRYNMKITDSDGTALVCKKTGWISNSKLILEELNLQCTNTGGPNDHRHADLQNGRAKLAQVYPEKLCLAILKGLRKELIKCGAMYVGEIGTICEDQSEKAFQNTLARVGAGGQYFDDVTGKPLDPELVRAGRLDEKAGVLKHKVFDKVPLSECFQETGKPPLDSRWLDINKGDEQNPDVRCRWVGMEFNRKNAHLQEGLFAATPPLEAKKVLISQAASQRNHNQCKKLGFIDIRKAYFHAPARRKLYVKLPPEFLEPGEAGQVCGRLNYSLYGTRDAASNWEEHYGQVLVSLGFTQGVSSPCIFYHKERDISTVVHGDDFTSLATEGQLIWMRDELSKQFTIKDRGIMGPDKHDIKEIRLLNRIIAWEHDAIRYEADQRHAEILTKSLQLDNAKGVETPGVVDHSRPDGDELESEALDSSDTTAYRACAARCNFLGLDRPDLQFAAKEVSRSMANPKQSDVASLKRLGRYVKKYPRAVFKFKFQASPTKIRIFSDTNWAGCLKTRKSTQGGVVMLGQHCVKTWSSTQGIISLSSGEAEYYGVVKAASVGLGLKAMLKDMGIQAELEVLTDATAAKGIASRRGLGSTRHIDVHYLWVQERIANKDLVLSKVWGHDNPADLLTKYLDSKTMKRHMALFGFEYMEGRSAEAPVLSHISAAHALRRKQKKNTASNFQ
jgi:hypothetical protein